MRKIVQNRLNRKQSLEEYNRIKYVAGILYPPVLYAFLLMAVQVAGNIYYGYVYASSIGERVTVGQSYEFLENVERLVLEHNYLLTMISAAIGLAVFMYIYETDAKSNGTYGLVRQVKDVKTYRLGYLMILGCVGNIGLSRLLSLLPLDNIIGSYKDTQETLLAGRLVIQILSVSILVPVTEELIYRGLVCERAKRLLGDKPAVFVSAGLFAVFHFNLLQGIYAFIVGVVLGYIYLKYDNIVYCILLHGIANLTAVLVNYFSISGYINKHIVLYLFVMLMELAVTIAVAYKIYKSRD